MLYLTLGSLIYKKEKRMEEIDRNIRTTHIQLEFCVETFDRTQEARRHEEGTVQLRQGVEEELAMLKEKQSKALETSRRRRRPWMLPASSSTTLWTRTTRRCSRAAAMELRSHLTKQEEVKIAAEREEIKRARLLRTAGAGAGAGAGAEQHRIGDNTAPARLE
ncbi:putative Paraflagellar rod protein [Trypanosoma vivax]|nr:putative Paraflagellar rod protein [Trypanosoma vivax]